jgi:hypothetical protein
MPQYSLGSALSPAHIDDGVRAPSGDPGCVHREDRPQPVGAFRCQPHLDRQPTATGSESCGEIRVVATPAEARRARPTRSPRATGHLAAARVTRSHVHCGCAATPRPRTRRPLRPRARCGRGVRGHRLHAELTHGPARRVEQGTVTAAHATTRGQTGVNEPRGRLMSARGRRAARSRCPPHSPAEKPPACGAFGVSVTGC